MVKVTVAAAALLLALAACADPKDAYFPEVRNSTKTEAEYKADVSSCYQAWGRIHFGQQQAPDAVAATMGNAASGAAIGAASGQALGGAAAGAGAGALAGAVASGPSTAEIDRSIHAYLDWCMAQKGYDVTPQCHNGLQYVSCATMQKGAATE